MLSQVNNLVFDGKRQDEKLAEAISLALVNDLPNLLVPELHNIPNVLGSFGNSNVHSSKTENTKSNVPPKGDDMKTSATAVSSFSANQSSGNSSIRYLFLLGVVPSIVGAFLAIGAEPLQALLVGAYVVTSYLFLVEKQWRSNNAVLSPIGRENMSAFHHRI